MDRAPQADLNMLDRDALVALVHAHQEELASLAADRDEQIRRLEAEVDSHRQTLSQQVDELSSRSERIEHMKLMIEKLRHMIFGTKSEKIILKLEQLEFQLEEQETTQAEAEAAVERVSPANKSKVRSGRKPLPAHLQREVVTHVPEGDCCADCGSQLRKFGEDISEQLEYIPDSFRVIRHVRPKFSCSGCDRVIEAPASSRPIEAVLPVLACWLMSSSLNTATICPSTGNQRFTPGRGLRYPAPRWPDGLAPRVICLTHW
jgi:transposase